MASDAPFNNHFSTASSSEFHHQPSPNPAAIRSSSQHLHDPCSPLQLARASRQRVSSHLTTDLPNLSIAHGPEQNVAPFLAKYSRKAHNPESRPQSSGNPMASTYCNRHRPEMKCWRQANEPTMDELQTTLSRLAKEDQAGISHVWSVFSAAPSKQRQLMLQGILAVCCFPQLSYVSAQVRELIKIDFISVLPTELSFKILSYLDTVSLCKAAQVSRTWNALAEDDVVWHNMCEQHIAKKCKKCGWGLPLLDHRRLQAEKKSLERRALGIPSDTPYASRAVSEAPSECLIPESHKRSAEDAELPDSKRICLLSAEPPERRPWKDVYKDRFKVGTNWKYGRHSLKVLKGHENGVMCLQFQDNVLASGSYDGTIKLWNLETGKELRTLLGHTSGIRCLQFSKCQLISGGMDKTIRIWNWETGELVRTLTGPKGDVLSIDFKAPYLVAGGKDNVVRVWNFQSKGVCALRIHRDFVNSVRIDVESRTIFSAADDNTICLWDLDTGKVIKTFEGHVGGVQQIALLPPQFELDESDLLDCEHPSSDSEPEREANSALEQEATGCLAIPAPPTRSRSSPCPEALPNISLFPGTTRPNPPTYMLTASLDSTLRLWHVPTGRCLRPFFGHIEGIWAIAADNLRVVSGSEDKTVKIWDPRSGKCERTFTGHAGPVTCVGLSGDRLITGSEDCEIRVMEFGPDTKQTRAGA